jgi:DNA helicase-2/ATP-dependent DNA helicase PcrA
MSEHLDDDQRAAVEAGERAISVLAGPGSGKTRVLSFRARHLLRRDARSKALLLTFTNKAAAEMKARAIQTAAVASNRILACTFHSFAQMILRSHAAILGLSPDFEILETEDQHQLAREAAQRAGVKDYVREWSKARVRRETPKPHVESFGQAYQALKKADGALDFDDLLIYAGQLFEEHPEIATAYGMKYAHLLLDEFQDTNAVQFALVRGLAAHSKTVSVFADDDQAIFRFAGADAEHIVRFTRELNAKPYPLTVNYRCREAIVARANLLIQADSSTSGRQMRAVRSGGQVDVCVFKSVDEEAATIGQSIATALKGGRKPDQMSILVRSGYRAEAILRALAAHGIPFSNWLDNGHESRERRTLRVCLAVAGDSLNGRHSARLCDMFKLPSSKERDTDAFLRQYAGRSGIAELARIRELARANAPVDEIVVQVQTVIGVIDEELAHGLTPLIKGVRAFKNHDPDFSLHRLLAELSLGNAGGAPTEGGGVKVASLHRTKGLQWPVVFMVGLEDDTLPSHQSLQDEQDIRQERRLCFVGVCRAEDQLTLTRAHQLKGWPKQPSRFLREMRLI